MALTCEFSCFKDVHESEICNPHLSEKLPHVPFSCFHLWNIYGFHCDMYVLHTTIR